MMWSHRRKKTQAKRRLLFRYYRNPYTHINPYGLFPLSMQERLVIEGLAA